MGFILSVLSRRLDRASRPASACGGCWLCLVLAHTSSTRCSCFTLAADLLQSCPHSPIIVYSAFAIMLCSGWSLVVLHLCCIQVGSLGALSPSSTSCSSQSWAIQAPSYLAPAWHSRWSPLVLSSSELSLRTGGRSRHIAFCWIPVSTLQSLSTCAH